MRVKEWNAALLSRAIAFSLPLILAAYWPFFALGHSVHLGVVALRALVLALVELLALLWFGKTSPPDELRSAAALFTWVGLLLVPALLGDDVSRGMHNWVRVLPVYAAAVFLARPLRHEGTRKAFSTALGIACVVSFFFVIVLYLHYAGLKIPTYDQIRILKTHVQHSSGVALNPLAFATILLAALRLSIGKPRRAEFAAAIIIAVLASALTGSRAPLALVLVSLVVTVLVYLLHSRSLLRRTAAYSALCAIAIAAFLAFQLAPPELLSSVTEGRYDLWTVGMAKFVESPLFGHGPESWRDDLITRLPGYYPGSAHLTDLRSGGYHSEYVTLLSEGGLLCFIPAMILLGLLLHGCWRLAFHRATPPGNAFALFFTFFLLVFRGTFEVPGLFGYGEDVTDYLAAVFIAIVISGLCRCPEARRARRAVPLIVPPLQVSGELS